MGMGKVWFIGAGPGDPELVTVKGARLMAEADLVLYAGSLVPARTVACARAGARVEDSSGLTLEQTHALMAQAARAGRMVARVHTGDPSLYGAVAEQARLLEAEGIPWGVVPGVTAAFAAAAEARVGFTVPGRVQSLVITRAPGRTAAPEAESLRSFAAHGCAMAVYLSAADAQGVADELLAGGLAPDTTAVVGYRVGWPGGGVAATTLAGLAQAAAEMGAGRQAVFLVLPGQDASGDSGTASRLYDPGFSHGFRTAAEDEGSGNG